MHSFARLVRGDILCPVPKDTCGALQAKRRSPIPPVELLMAIRACKLAGYARTRVRVG